MFTNLINKTKKVIHPSKHQASKGGFAHTKKLSKGELNHILFNNNKKKGGK